MFLVGKIQESRGFIQLIKDRTHISLDCRVGYQLG